MVFFRDDESTDDYKIVELAKIYLQTHPYYIIKGRIYSLKTGKWKNLVARDESSTQRIVSLDLAKEAYGEVLQYEHDEDVTKLITLGVLGECLCGILKLVKHDGVELVEDKPEIDRLIGSYQLVYNKLELVDKLLRAYQSLFSAKDKSLNMVFKFLKGCLVQAGLPHVNIA
ncbi:hypothetical protein Tco_0200417 [Tanacetum coccineum]